MAEFLDDFNNLMSFTQGRQVVIAATRDSPRTDAVPNAHTNTVPTTLNPRTSNTLTVTSNVPITIPNLRTDAVPSMESIIKVINEVEAERASEIRNEKLKRKDNEVPLESVIARVLPPLEVVGDIVENSGINIRCPRGHVHHMFSIDIIARTPVCATCQAGGATAKKIRTLLEDVFSCPFTLVETEKNFIHFVGTAARGDTAHLPPEYMHRAMDVHAFIVKRGFTPAVGPGLNILLPESQSMILIKDQIVKQCAGYNFDSAVSANIKNLQPRAAKTDSAALPYSRELASGPGYRILAHDGLFIENCGWKKV